MAKLKMKFSHAFSEDQALIKVRTLLCEAKEKFGGAISDLQENWDGTVGTFGFTAMGFSISGTLTVRARELFLDAEVPFFTKGTIRSVLEEQARLRGFVLVS